MVASAAMRADPQGPLAALEAALRDPDTRVHWDPWLVYGDWLDAHGDVRGRLIALEHRRATAVLDDYAARTLTAEIEALVAAEGEAWVLPDMPAQGAVQLRHGFVVGLSLALTPDNLDLLARWLELGHGRLLSELRLVLHAEEEGEGGQPGWQPDSPWTPVPVPLSEVEQLLALDLGGLSRLGLTYGSLGPAGVAALGRCDALARLRHLDLSCAHIGDAGLEALAAAAVFAPSAGPLDSLTLDRNAITAAGLRALVAAPFAPALRHLDLRENPIGDDGARVLANAERLPLQRLDLHFGDVGPDGTRILAGSKHLSFSIRRRFSTHYGIRRGPTDPA